jgi:hypothetical protein
VDDAELGKLLEALKLNTVLTKLDLRQTRSFKDAEQKKCV